MGKNLKVIWVNIFGSNIWDEHMKSLLESAKRPDVDVDVVHLRKGPPHTGFHYYEFLAIEDELRVMREAERDGYSAAVMACWYDTGLREAREILKMPVIGPGETCMHVACMLGNRFSIITLAKSIAKMRDHAAMYGVLDKVASFRTIASQGTFYGSMSEEREKIKESIKQEAKKAVEEDYAEVITPACTFMSGFTELSEELGVPVVDPVIVPFKWAETMADLYSKFGISHSKVYGYSPPPNYKVSL